MRSLFVPASACRDWFRLWWCGGGLVCLGMVLGCSQEVSESIVDHQMTVSRADQLRVTTDYIFTDEQFDNTEFEQKVAGGLNRWYASRAAETPAAQWHPDPLIDTLPPQVRGEADGLDSMTYLTADAHYLQGQMWTRELVKTIAERPLARNFWPPLSTALGPGDVAAAWNRVLEEVYPELSPAERSQLLLGCKLFDWTILNLQLSPERPWPTPAEVAAQRLVENDESWPPAVGVRGPGYDRFVWQSLLFGQGDDLARARVFLQLAREANLTGVLLAVKTAADDPRTPFGYRWWLPALKIGNELVLFDTELGLPLPASDPRRFATLAAVVAQPELLRELDLRVEESTSSTANYRIRPDDLQRGIVALIETPLEALTQRMAVLERSLTGDERLQLTTQPTAIATAVRGLAGVAEVRLSALDACTQQFRRAVSEGEQTAKFNADIRERLLWLTLEEEYVNSFVRYRKARNKYFRNQMLSPRGVTDRGAIEWFQLMRYDDRFIDTLHENTNVLEALGIGPHLPAVEYSRRLANTKEHMALVRADSTYQLALSQLMLGNPSVAATWLGRVAEFDARKFWDTGVRYLQGRCAEMLDDLPQALELYRVGKDDPQLKPQVHGNLLRARLLSGAASSHP